jgi:two-component system, chemotaxis family, sensor kinase CheA
MSDTEIVQEFLVESYENLDRLDRELVSLEKSPGDAETLASVFRTIHTIKGTCGFLGFSKLEAVAHVGENLLSKLRDGLIHSSPDVTSGLLAMVDAVRQMLTSIERTGEEGDRDDAKLIATITALLNQGQTPEGASPVVSRSTAAVTPENSDTLAIDIPRETPAALPVKPAPEIPVDDDLRHLEVAEAAQSQHAARGQQSSVAESTIRVDVGLLDKLMNLVGELVLARNQILQFTNSSQDSGLLSTSQRLNLLTTEIQSAVMKTRMQPIGNIWSKFPRTVRDLALACGKEVIVEMDGKETELDKTIIESIKDPLTQVMQHLDDINEVGKGIAVAFVATLYGVGVANLVLIPSAGKLKIRLREAQIIREMILDGVISILEGLNPRMIETRLLSYLADMPPQEQERGVVA